MKNLPIKRTVNEICKRAKMCGLIQTSADFQHAVYVISLADLKFGLRLRDWLHAEQDLFEQEFFGLLENLDYKNIIPGEIDSVNFGDYRPIFVNFCDFTDVEKYYQDCLWFWKHLGYSDSEAESRALWWDCAEKWNNDGSWSVPRINFFAQYRTYEPYAPLPERDAIMQGTV